MRLYRTCHVVSVFHYMAVFRFPSPDESRRGFIPPQAPSCKLPVEAWGWPNDKRPTRDLHVGVLPAVPYHGKSDVGFQIKNESTAGACFCFSQTYVEPSPPKRTSPVFMYQIREAQGKCPSQIPTSMTQHITTNNSSIINNLHQQRKTAKQQRM